MDHDIVRRRHFEQTIRGTESYRVSGVHGKSMEKKFREFGLIQNSRRSCVHKDAKLSLNEIGCVISFLKIMEQTIAPESPDYIVICEDDADIITWMNKEAEKMVLDNYTKYDCIQLSIILSKQNLEIVKKEYQQKSIHIADWNEKNNKSSPWGFFWSSAASLISKKGRLKILQKFRWENSLRAADFFVYERLTTGTIIPPLICQYEYSASTIHADIDCHIQSRKLITDAFFKKKLCLIALFFGTLPDYFNLWLSTLRGQSYDILFVTDQDIVRSDLPENVKYIYMSFDALNARCSELLGGTVKMFHPEKIVDIKPCFGKLFQNYVIPKYEYWGWTDIDMLMGDVTMFMDSRKGYSVYSTGQSTFGPIMTFHVSRIDIYKVIPNYAELLNIPYICKIDEMWFFELNDYCVDGQVYTDILKTVVFDKRALELKRHIELLDVCVFEWFTADTGIEWGIKNIIRSEVKEWKWICQYDGKKLIINNREITHCHLTLLKLNKDFLCKMKAADFSESSFILVVTYTVKDNANDPDENIDELNIYEIFDQYVNIDIELTPTKSLKFHPNFAQTVAT